MFYENARILNDKSLSIGEQYLWNSEINLADPRGNSYLFGYRRYLQKRFFCPNFPLQKLILPPPFSPQIADKPSDSVFV